MSIIMTSSSHGYEVTLRKAGGDMIAFIINLIRSNKQTQERPHTHKNYIHVESSKPWVLYAR